MNNFIFENKTKVYFGRGGVREYLGCLLKKYGDMVMLAYGGGSIKKNGTFHVWYYQMDRNCPSWPTFRGLFPSREGGGTQNVEKFYEL